ncbi:MAG: TetR/AcrR family transcriptional regulator [Rhodococcus sp.]|nr:TetR/AcrR family transcriptional regulator [Rhodococcus sp. (in: high G+C Gram-positive bacteria)]
MTSGSQNLPRRRTRTLSRAKIVDAAIAIIDDDGPEQLSMTKLSARVGVAAASLYNHVKNLDDVRGAVQVHTMEELGHDLRVAAMGRSGLDGMHALTDAHRRFAAAHPRRYRELTAAPANRDAFVLAALDGNVALTAMLRSCGLEHDDALPAAVAIFAALHGFAMLETTDFLGGEMDADSIYTAVRDGALNSVGITAG